MMAQSRRAFLIGATLTTAALALPKRVLANPAISDMGMYEVGGITMFPVYGLSGGLCAKCCVIPMLRLEYGYLICRYDVTLMDVNPEEERETFYRRVERESKLQFAERLHTQKQWVVVEDGGPFPESGIVAVLRTKKGLHND